MFAKFKLFFFSLIESGTAATAAFNFRLQYRLHLKKVGNRLHTVHSTGSIQNAWGLQCTVLL